MQWSDLLAAFALYLVLEGLMPFLNPGGMKRALCASRACRTCARSRPRQHDRGVGLLYFVRG